jgi:hypothetical protein
MMTGRGDREDVHPTICLWAATSLAEYRPPNVGSRSLVLWRGMIEVALGLQPKTMRESSCADLDDDQYRSGIAVELHMLQRDS